MAAWNDAWFSGRPMPPHGFPIQMLMAAQAIAEQWLFDAQFRCILEEWVPRQQAVEVLGGLLWSGFRVRGQPSLRRNPKPVMVRLLYTEPQPTSATELRSLMRSLFNRAVREWIEAHLEYGHDLQCAP
jgi:hypothetical protein